MSSFLSAGVSAPVPNAFTEIAPATTIGFFACSFGTGPEPSMYIRPGSLTQQDYLNDDGSEWLLYTKSVMSFRVEVLQTHVTTIGGASLVIEVGDIDLMGVPQLRDWRPFHFGSGNMLQTTLSNLELPGLFARFRIQTTCDTPLPGGNIVVRGSIIVRGL